MKRCKKSFGCFASALALAISGSAHAEPPLQAHQTLDKVNLIKGEIPKTPPKVEFKQNAEGYWRIVINNVETPIRGAGGVLAPGMLEHFKASGGNFTRTWGMDSLEDIVGGGERYVDRAYRLGINVMPGFWVGHERHGFNYANALQLKKQRDDLRAAIRKYKNHPAIVMWGLGNEMEDPTSQAGNPLVWKELEVLAKIIKEEDPNRPVMTVIAGAGPAKIKNILQYYPSIDALGVNAYGGASGAGEALLQAGWKKPFAITEFGVQGFWEVGKTAWGAPIEPNSSEKARSYYASHTLVCSTNDGKEMCLGTFAFLWGWKQECTATWFGMVLPTMEKLPQVDAMVKAWTGEWPENRCPSIKEIKASFFAKEIEPNGEYKAEVIAEDPNGDTLQYDWVVISETSAVSTGGDHEKAPPAHPELTRVNHRSECVFTSPQQPGAYRLFLTLRDGKGGAATANIPFKVKKS